MSEPIYCSFCGASSNGVHTMITHSNANICDLCVVECMEMIVRRFAEDKKPVKVMNLPEKDLT